MSDETIAQPKIKLSWLAGTFVAFALFAVIGAYSSRMAEDYPSFDQDRSQARYATLAKLQQDENKLINPVDAKGNPTAEWIDQDKGIIRIPIEDAMSKEVDALKAKPLHAGNAIPVATPAPAPAAAPGASTNAAPAAATNAPAASAPATKPKK